MRHTLITILLLIQPAILFPQVVLTIEGQEIIDTETGVSNGYNIPRSKVTALTFRNNSLISVNSAGYILQAGDEGPGLNNNHLDGAIITGNRFVWNGTDETSMTHALFTGYNLDVIIKYNYLLNTPNGIQRKSNGMTDKSGVIAYNIINNPRAGIVAKGMSGVRIFNNTLYCGKTPEQTGRGLIDIHTNTDDEINFPSTGTKIFNNIFYTKHNTYSINVMDKASLAGLESDYNVFWCETGSPKFNAGGSVKTFAEWQALGYDVHSKVIDPKFNNFADFNPAVRLDYGNDLGSGFSEGLATDAIWSNVTPHTARQNGAWQVGARLYEGEISEAVDLLEDAVRIYPNPANDVIYIMVTGMGRIYETFKIFDSHGKMVLTSSLEYGLNPIDIPDHISPGLYIVSLEAANLETYTRKILIIT